MVKSGDGCCWGVVTYGCLFGGSRWGESGHIGCIRSRV